MKLDLRYWGRSGVYRTNALSTVHFAPNLARERVAFSGELKDPLRYREAISALHDVVVSDMRFKKRGKEAYQAYKEGKEREEKQLREQILGREQDRERAKIAQKGPPPKNLDAEFRAMHRLYWNARIAWANELARTDPQLWRHLVPCDPIVSVAPDVVFFEGFAKDESSYGAVYVDRELFEGAQHAELGTTNVDYSLALYRHFQTLRSYRPTRLEVDPEGFEVAVIGHESYREEKIDLPPSWLRGFGQISAATSLPATQVTLPVEVLYSVLGHLRRNREKTGPRSIRFELSPGKPPALVLEPWEKRIESRGPVFAGDEAKTIKMWGRRRLAALARLLPLCERIDVHLLGSGLPSAWVARLGPIQFVLALSGWSANDFTSGSQLDLLTGHMHADARIIERLAKKLVKDRSADLDALCRELATDRRDVLAGLHHLAKRGQLVYDFAHGRYRYRQILSVELGDSLLGAEPEELREARKLLADRRIDIAREEPLPGGRRIVVGRAAGTGVEAILDADGVFVRGSCPCPYHMRFGVRRGACRHLLALRLASQSEAFLTSAPRQELH